MRKKLLILLMATTIVFNSYSNLKAVDNDNSKGNSTSEATQPVNPEYLDIKSSITNISGTSTIVAKPGDTKSIRVFVDFTYPVSNNPFSPNAYRNQFTISGFADTEGNNNIYMTKANDEVRPGGDRRYGPSGSTSLNFDLEIARDAKPGTYPVKININTSDGQTRTFVTYVRVEYDPRQSSKLVLSDIRIMPKNTDITPGENVIAGFVITNPTERVINDVEVRLDGMSEDGFTLRRDFNAKNIPSIGPNQEKRMSFVLAAGQNAKPGNHEFKVTLSYRDMGSEGGESKTTKSFFLTLKKDPASQSSVVIENLVTPANTIYPGKSATLSFNVSNKGKGVAKRVLIKSSVEGDGLVNKSISQHFIESLQPGESKPFSFTYLATPASSTQNYPITIKVEYRDEFNTTGDPLTTEQYSGVFVSNPEKDKKAEGDGKEEKISTPKVIVRKYIFDPKLPEAGKDFKMTLQFQNTSSNKIVKNIKISLNSPTGSDNKETAGSNIFTPIDSSNTFFIDKIMPNGVVEKVINLYTVPDAVAKTYNVKCEFEYEDALNNQFKAEEEIGIPVVQSSRLQIGQIQTQNSFTAGEGAPLSVAFYNTGKVTLYNMMVRFESEDLQAQNSTYYVGKFLEGATENYDIQVNSMEPGQKKGNLIFTYEDSTGEKQEVKKELTWDVQEAPAFDPNDPANMPPMEEPSFMDKVKNVATKWYTWAILVAVILIVLFIVKHFKKKKEKKDLTLDV